LRNGVDFEAFNVAEAKHCPDDLAAIPEPRIGYTGSVNQKVDYGLIASIARKRRDLNWVLVGPVGVGNKDTLASNEAIGASYRECRALPNVHFLGGKPFFELPKYMSNMTVNTMCYRTDGSGWWKAIDPLKTNEYLASGKPIISADLVNVRPFSDCIRIARTETEWLEAIDRALSQEMPDLIAKGRERARQSDWSVLTDEFEALLLEQVGNHPANSRATA
jgi:UDP-galactopyranose mutase